MAKLGTNLTQYPFEIELYMISASLEIFECRNQDTINHVTSSSQAERAQCSMAMGEYFLKINIFKHIKCFFSTIRLAPGH